MDVTTATPREIDTRLAELHEQAAKARHREQQTLASLHSAVGDRGRYVSRSRKQYNLSDQEAEAKAREMADGDTTYRGREAQRTLDRLDGYRRQAEQAREAAKPLNAEFQRRGGWSRFFLVTSSNGGHVHSSMSCSTCQVTTTYGRLPEVSGKTEADAVAEHGPLLCSVCLPTAPVEWTVGKQKPANPDQCPGSGTWDYPRETARLGYYTGNYGVCSHCGQTVTVTSTNKMRKHKAETVA